MHLYLPDILSVTVIYNDNLFVNYQPSVYIIPHESRQINYIMSFVVNNVIFTYYYFIYYTIITFYTHLFYAF